MQTIVNRLPFANRLSVRAKINLTVAMIFILVVGSVTVYSGIRQKEAILLLAEQQIKDTSTLYFDSLNTMMLTGTMDQRNILREKMLRRNNVLLSLQNDSADDQCHSRKETQCYSHSWRDPVVVEGGFDE